MADLTGVTFRDLLPPNLKDDPDALAASRALDTDFREWIGDLWREVIYANIDALDGAVLDRLAYDLHVDWYDTALAIEQRRALVRNSLPTHMRKGTPWAVERIVSDAFGNAAVTEWYEYGGEPYFFRIVVEDAVTTMNMLHDVLHAINAVKNVRSWLEYIKFRNNAYARMYIGGPAIPYEHVTTQLPPAPDAVSPLYMGAAAVQYTHDTTMEATP